MPKVQPFEIMSFNPALNLSPVQPAARQYGTHLQPRQCSGLRDGIALQDWRFLSGVLAFSILMMCECVFAVCEDNRLAAHLP